MDRVIIELDLYEELTAPGSNVDMERIGKIITKIVSSLHYSNVVCISNEDMEQEGWRIALGMIRGKAVINHNLIFLRVRDRLIRMLQKYAKEHKLINKYIRSFAYE